MYINFTNILVVSKRTDIIYFTTTYLNDLIPVTVIPEVTSENDYFISLILYDCSFVSEKELEHFIKSFSTNRFSKIVFIIPIEASGKIKKEFFSVSKYVLPFPCKKQYLIEYIKKCIAENKQEVNYNSIKRVAAGSVSNPVVNSLFGCSKEMQLLKQQIVAYAKFDSPLLLCGESGTGKSTIAKLIHELSSRKKANFVGVNSSFLSNSLADAALFGAVEGAYTDGKGQQGFFMDADRGTLFFDEISSTSIEFQSKLLSTLDSGEFFMVGSNIKYKVDVRTIFATNDDLEEKMIEGKFRRDLYFRISANIIKIPPLRNRPCDIIVIANEIAKNKKKTFSEGALKKLQCYEWPGNVRELENCINRAVVLSDDNIIRENNIFF